jgi:hypothetical protein
MRRSPIDIRTFLAYTVLGFFAGSASTADVHPAKIIKFVSGVFFDFLLGSGETGSGAPQLWLGPRKKISGRLIPVAVDAQDSPPYSPRVPRSMT